FARYLVIPLLCFLASSFAQTQFIRSYEEYHKLDSKKTPHVPKVRWIAMGLQSGRYEKEKGRGIDYVTSPKNMDRIPVGTWNGFLYGIHANAPIAESKLQSYEAIRKSLRGFCADPLYAFEFFSRKIATLWGHPDFHTHPIWRKDVGLSYFQNSWDSGKIGEVGRVILHRKSWFWIGLEPIQEGWHFIVLLFSMIGFVFLFRGGNSTRSPEALLIALILLGGFSLYLLWEAAPLYGMPLFLFLIMASAHGIARFSWAGLWAWFARSKRVSGVLLRFRQGGRS
ncbi:MAG: hypothetical protein LBG65_05805, partial [Puniceicoccales bacterium]|nr:hypothetical protein [Puniceicoccales bacterium]